MADPIVEGTGEIVDLVDWLLVTTQDSVDEHRESVGVAAAAMVVAALVGSLVGLGLYFLVAQPPRLWPMRSIGALLCIATLRMVWIYGRASFVVWPSHALGSGAIGITSMTILFLVGLIRGFSGRSQGESHDETMAPATA
jgi:hypothetical protein